MQPPERPVHTKTDRDNNKNMVLKMAPNQVNGGVHPITIMITTVADDIIRITSTVI